MEPEIEGLSSGARLLRGPAADPDSPEGTETFARLFGIGDAGGLGTYPHSIPGDTVMRPHHHTGPVAACLTAGRMRFGFGGGDIGFHVEIGPGDYLFIPAGLAHSEDVVSAEPALMFVAHLGAFDTIDA
jgi:uncharacterized RmlC-like cupin family protein